MTGRSSFQYQPEVMQTPCSLKIFTPFGSGELAGSAAFQAHTRIMMTPEGDERVELIEQIYLENFPKKEEENA